MLGKRIRRRLKHWALMRGIYRDRFEMYGRKITDMGEIRTAFQTFFINGIVNQIANNIPKKIQVQITRMDSLDAIEPKFAKFNEECEDDK